ncbi:TPM domain-containing protein [Sphingobacterium sp. SGL-16]|uniref:TPM domain-containing protein n=1 Tax=Sphingobacterium sp. SGL-16 TaxID=2710883 RepID=UPI0013EE0BDE|nr:TPM domain-containing protein [Sphingobacterium sp. SGL-16]NGM73720.1 TPM domain-containing protein [Sphingobacterium sp. SGL-16]
MLTISKIKFYYHLILALVLSVCILGSVQAQDLPEVSRTIVTDYTNSLSPTEKDALERKLVAFNDTTSTQIAVVLVNSTDGYDVADYAVRLAQKWGVGQAKYNNGVMLLAAIGDRAVTIQTGYGVEGALPDAIAYRIIENDIKPAFRSGNYFKGLDNATNSIISYTKGEYKEKTRKDSASNEGGGISGIMVIIIIVIIFALISKGGGGNNRGGKMIDGKGSNDLFWWMLLNGMGGGSKRSSGGGFGGFGGGFGGGSSGGGFGGFGGGGFGGGGASGRW